MNINKIANLLNYLATGMLLTLLSACTLTPEKITPAEKLKTTKNTLAKLHTVSDSETIRIDLKKAIALALERNLDYRVANIQTALSYKQYDLAKLDLYPKVNGNYNYSHRNKDVQENLGGANPSGLQVLAPRTDKVDTFLINWAALDFGLGYVRAKQAADRYLATQEQRKVQTAKIINEVIKSYIFAYYGQELSKKVIEIDKLVNSTVVNIETAIREKVGDRMQLLTLKKDLITNYQAVTNYLIVFNQSRTNLLKLINYNSKKKLEMPNVQLAPPGQYLTKLPAINSSQLSLDTVAIFYRPELTQANYKTQETQRQKLVSVLERLPSFGFTFGFNHDSNKYNVYRSWLSDNMNAAWNLLNLAALPADLDLAETQLETSQLTYLASSAVVLGEIRVLLYNYKMKLYDYTFAEKATKYVTDIHNQNIKLVSARMLDKQALTLSELTTISSELQKIKTFIEARTTLEDLILSLGLYNTKGELIAKDYVDTEAIDRWIDSFNLAHLDDIIKQENVNISKADKPAVNTLTGLHSSSAKPITYLNSDEENLKRPTTSTNANDLYDQSNPSGF